MRPELRMCATPNIIGASRVPNLHGVELAGYGILTAAGQSFAHLWRALGIVCAESNWRKQSSFLIHGAMERQRRSSGLRFRTSRRSAKFRLFQSSAVAEEDCLCLRLRAESPHLSMYHWRREAVMPITVNPSLMVQHYLCERNN